MDGIRGRSPRRRAACIVAAVLLLAAASAQAQAVDSTKPRIKLYGRVQADGGYDFGAIDPDYADRLRTSALPSFEDEFGANGRTYFSARQSRLGLEAHYPTELGEIFAILEFDFIGTGDDAGKTLPRLRHAYAELGAFGAGLYWSPFVDPDAYPSLFESFGPTGIPHARNVQLRWMPLRGDTRVTIAVEKPGASGEGGDYDQLVELEDVQIRLGTPEWTAAVRHGGGWGHVQLAGLLRRIWWDDLNDDPIDLSGDAMGWGVSLTPVIAFGEKNAVKLQFLIGEGVENYLNDNTVDIAPVLDLDDPFRPLDGAPLPVKSFTGYVEWYEGRWGFVGGFSTQDVDNVEGQEDTAFSGADYATAAVVYYPVANVLTALEYQYGRRRNFDDEWRFSDHRLQLTARFNFDVTIGSDGGTRISGR